MRSSSCLPARDWNSTKPPYWMNEGGLGLKTSARSETGTFRFLARFPVSVKSEKSEKRKANCFFSRLRTSANTKNSRLTREIPLVPRVKTSPSDPRAKRSLRTSRVPSKQKANEKQIVRNTKLNATKLVYLFNRHLQAIFLQSPLAVVFFGAFTVFSAARQVRDQKPSAYI